MPSAALRTERPCVTWRGADFPLTHELTYDPRGGIVETDLYVMAPTRMALADGDGRTLYAAPFELSETDAVLGPFGLDAGWLTRIHVERRMSDALQRDTELVPAEFEEEVARVIDRETRVRIAQGCCNGNQIPDSDAPGRTFVELREYPLGEAPSDDTLFYSAPPQDPDYCVGGALYDEPVHDYDYGCTVVGAAFSWSPLVMALWLTARRRSRQRIELTVGVFTRALPVAAVDQGCSVTPLLGVVDHAEVGSIEHRLRFSEVVRLSREGGRLRRKIPKNRTQVSCR